MNKIGTKIIDTERCILRRIVPDDYQMMYENWAKYEEVCRYFPFNPVTDMEIYKENNVEDFKNFLKSSYKIKTKRTRIYSSLPLFTI